MTFGASDVVQLVILLIVGGLISLLWMVIAFNKTTRDRVGWSLVVLVLYCAGVLGLYYKVIAQPQKTAEQERKKAGLPFEQEYKERYAKAKALFDERCKTAGENIYYTAEGVEGVFLRNIRADDKLMNEANPNWPDAGLPNERSGEDYIATFLMWEQHQDKRNPRGGLNYTPSDLPGYEYVDVQSGDGLVYRYTLAEPGNPDSTKLSKSTLRGEPARYAVSFVNILNDADRQSWVAGTTVTIVDTQTSKVMAESTWYALEPGQGSKAGARQPWRFAFSCPDLRGSQVRSPTRFFVDQILKPKKR